MRFYFFLSFLALAQPLSAACGGPNFFERLSPEDQQQLETLADETPYGRGLLWKATRDEAEITVVGTMHIYDPRLDTLFDQVRADIANADLLLVEASAEEEAKMQKAMSEDPSMIFITDGPTLPEQLDPELWDALAEASRARQVPPFLAAKMQPWYLSMTLSIPPCAMSDLATGIRGLDHMIMQEAETKGVPIHALEPYTTLFNIMRDGSFDEQVEMLQLALIAPEIHSEMFVAMLESYFAQEVALVWEASRLATAYVPGLDQDAASLQFAQTEQALLIDRNHNWMPVIASHSFERAMVAVGAAHLIGEDGILRLLENDGWTITPY